MCAVDNQVETGSETGSDIEKFRSEFVWHYTHGTHGDGPFISAWTPPRLREALRTILGPHLPSDVAIRNWFRPTSVIVPPDRMMSALLDVFFGASPDRKPERRKLELLWMAAKAAKPNMGDDDSPAPEPPRVEWTVAEPDHRATSIAVLNIQRPVNPNDTEELWRLEISLRFGLARQQIGGLPFVLGLRRAWIEPVYQGCQPSGAPNAHALLEPDGGNFTVLGPLHEPTQLFRGTALERHTLATLEFTGGPTVAAGVALKSLPLDLDVVPEGDPATPLPEEKRAVLKRFLQECAVETGGQAVWSTARIERKDKA